MKRAFSVVFILLVGFLAPASLSAKGYTVKITIKGASLTTPLEITDPNVGQFSVWAGFGTFLNGVEQTEGFIIQWLKGIVKEPPTGLERYEVSFYTNREPAQLPGQHSYVVSYAYDPSTAQGYIYLPGRADELFKFNSAIWHGHGFEGSWSHATIAWENFVRPLIAKARTESRTSR